MATEEECINQINALKNQFYLTWCHEYDLTTIGGILWYKANGAYLGLTPQEPREALSALQGFIAEAQLQVPTYCKPLNKMIMLQGSHQPGLEAHFPGRASPDSTKILPEKVDLEYESMIPVGDHPGAFAAVRKNHIHEGVDLYANANDRVYAMVAGKVVDIDWFTGTEAGSPWWNDTCAVAIEDEAGVWFYGEILPGSEIKVGDEIRKGQDIGKVIPVLKVDKGRPMAMLHLERYTVGTTESVGLWELNTPQPSNLIDPTPELVAGLLLAQETSE